MNFLETAFTGKNNWWRYVVMIVVTLIASNTIGSLPLIIALFAKAADDPGVITQFAENPGNYGLLGLDSFTGLIVMIFPFIAGLAAFVILVKPLNGRTFKMTLTGSGKIRWSHFFISALVWLILSAIYLFVYLKIDPSNFMINNQTISLLLISVIAIVFIPFQAAYEEVIFRGYLMQGFATVLRYRWFPLIMTSVLFGLLHSLNPEVKEFGFFTMMPQYIVFGLIFGIVTIMDDGIEASMGAHAANNIFLVIMVTHESSALQSPALYEQVSVHPWTEFAGLAFSGGAFIIILNIIFRWKDYSVLLSRAGTFHNSPEN
jgi:uncharacterized protein